MESPGETFVTMNHSQFVWPDPRQLLARPAKPPVSTGRRLYEKRITPDDCRCDTHAFESDLGRYKKLSQKAQRLYNEVKKNNRDMSNLISAVLDHCDLENELMKSVYQTEYEKRGMPLAKYRTLIAAVDSPIGSPIYPIVKELRNAYRDPTRFRYSAIEQPRIQPATTVNFLRIPETYSTWQEPFTGQSEYTDTISKLGLINMRNRQQYLEPLPSSRRRWGDM